MVMFYKLKKFIAVPLVAVMILSTMLLTSCDIEHLSVKYFSSPEEYMAYVVSSNIDDVADVIAKMISVYKHDVADGVSSKGKLSVDIEDKFYDVLEDLGGGEVVDYISWAENIFMDFEVGSDDAKSRAVLNLGINDVDIAKLDFVTDLEANEGYIGIDEYNPKYLRTELDMGNEDISEMADVLRDTIKAFPDKELSKELILKYVKVIVDSFENVEKTSEKITVENISQDVTSLSVELNGILIKNIALNLLNTLKDDEDIKGIIGSIADIYGEDVDDAWDELDDAIESIEDSDADDYDLGIMFTVYVDSNGEISGFVIESDEFSVSHTAPEKGGKFASLTEIRADGSKIKIEGEGKTSVSSESGTYKLKVNGMSVLELETENVSKSLMEEGIFNGTATVRLTEDAVDMIESQSYGNPALAELANVSLVIDSKTKSMDSGESTISVKYKDNPCIGLTFSASREKAEKISLPTSYVDVEDSDRMLVWARRFDFALLAEKMKEANVADELVDAVEEMEAMMEY